MWLFLALLTAFLTALADTATKVFLKGLSAPQLAVARVAGPVVLLLPLLLGVPWPPLGRSFWTTVLILLPLETTALLLYMEAIRSSPLSLTLPFLAFTPTFMIITGAVILGEHLTWTGIGGIVLVAAGSYWLHLDLHRWQNGTSLHGAVLQPIKSMTRERGSLLMLAVASIYSVTSVLGKRAVLLSTPIFFAAFYFVIHGLFATAAISLIFRVKPWSILRRNIKGVVVVGVCQGLMVITHMAAISMAPAAYMIAVKRTSILFGVLMGCTFLGESGLLQRLTGALLMVAGVFCIVSG